MSDVPLIGRTASARSIQCAERELERALEFWKVPIVAGIYTSPSVCGVITQRARRRFPFVDFGLDPSGDFLGYWPSSSAMIARWRMRQFAVLIVHENGDKFESMPQDGLRPFILHPSYRHLVVTQNDRNIMLCRVRPGQLKPVWRFNMAEPATLYT